MSDDDVRLPSDATLYAPDFNAVLVPDGRGGWRHDPGAFPDEAFLVELGRQGLLPAGDVGDLTGVEPGTRIRAVVLTSPDDVGAHDADGAVRAFNKTDTAVKIGGIWSTPSGGYDPVDPRGGRDGIIRQL